MRQNKCRLVDFLGAGVGICHNPGPPPKSQGLQLTDFGATYPTLSQLSALNLGQMGVPLEDAPGVVLQGNQEDTICCGPQVYDAPIDGFRGVGAVRAIGSCKWAVCHCDISFLGETPFPNPLHVLPMGLRTSQTWFPLGFPLIIPKRVPPASPKAVDALFSLEHPWCVILRALFRMWRGTKGHRQFCGPPAKHSWGLDTPILECNLDKPLTFRNLCDLPLTSQPVELFAQGSFIHKGQPPKSN